MRHTQQGLAFRAKRADSGGTLFLKVRISHGQHLVNDQDRGIDVNRNRKRQTDNHTARVGTKWLMNEVAQLSKFKDFGQALPELLFSEAEKGGVQGNIFDSCQIGVKS